MKQVLQHLHDRHLDTALHDVWVDEESRVATFPLWTLTGKLAGYQVYRPEADKVRKNDEYGRYYTYRGDKLVPKQPHSVAVWGMESWYFSRTLFVTEGIFNACRFTELGYSAVAVLSNDPSTSTRNWFKLIRAGRPVVAICDPGKAGYKLRNLGHQYHIVNVPGMPDADVGDAPQRYVKELIKQYA